jgi:hypothetical protein
MNLRALLLAVLAALLVAPASARADGDPASDVLLTQDSFLPYAPPVQERLKRALEDVLEQARKAGFPMKVALIMTERDLGAYPDLFNDPQKYADLLTSELATLNPHGDPLKAVHLLVVMPGGFGGNNLGEKVDDALGQVAIEGEAQSDGLAKAAVESVARLATVNGHEVPVPPEADLRLTASDADTEAGGTSPLVFAAPAVLLFAGLVVAGRIARRRERLDSDV